MVGGGGGGGGLNSTKPADRKTRRQKRSDRKKGQSSLTQTPTAPVVPVAMGPFISSNTAEPPAEPRHITEL